MTDTTTKGRPKKAGTINVNQIITKIEDNDKAMNIHRTYEAKEIELAKLLEELMGIYKKIQFSVNLTELLDDYFYLKEANESAFKAIEGFFQELADSSKTNIKPSEVESLMSVKAKLLSYDLSAIDELPNLFLNGVQVSQRTSDKVIKPVAEIKKAVASVIVPKFLDQVKALKQLNLKDNAEIMKYISHLEAKIAELSDLREEVLKMDTRSDEDKAAGMGETQKTTLQNLKGNVGLMISYLMGKKDSDNKEAGAHLQDAAWIKTTHFVHQAFIDNMLGNAKFACFATAAAVIEEEHKQCVLSSLEDKVCATKKQMAFMGAQNCNEIFSMSTPKDNEITDLLQQSSNVTTVIAESGTTYYINGKVIGESHHFIGSDNTEQLILAITADGAAAKILDGQESNDISMASIIGDHTKTTAMLGCNNCEAQAE